MMPFVLILATLWGIFYALFLQFVPLGQFLARKRTWLSVAIGVGVDLGLAALVIPFEYWRPFAAIVALSALGVILRSLANEQTEIQEDLDAVSNRE